MRRHTSLLSGIVEDATDGETTSLADEQHNKSGSAPSNEENANDHVIIRFKHAVDPNTVTYAQLSES